MMLPNQITLQSFSQNGKGGYKAIEVDAFLQRVFQSYNKLYNDNKALCEKLDETAPLIEEYNKRKNSIADALIWAKSTAEKNIEEAQSIADKLIYEASEKADKMYEDKKSEADTYYNAKTSEADKRAEKAKSEFESIKKQAEASKAGEYAFVLFIGCIELVGYGKIGYVLEFFLKKNGTHFDKHGSCAVNRFFVGVRGKASYYESLARAHSYVLVLDNKVEKALKAIDYFYLVMLVIGKALAGDVFCNVWTNAV